MPIQEHTQAMHGHMDQLEGHHARLGGGVTELYAALDLAAQLMQKLTEVYGELQGTHAEMHHTVNNARVTTSSIHEEAANSNTN